MTDHVDQGRIQRPTYGRSADLVISSSIVRKEEHPMPRILLVEDNEMNRDMLIRRLERRDFEVIIAVNGLEGVEKASSELRCAPGCLRPVVSETTGRGSAGPHARTSANAASDTIDCAIAAPPNRTTTYPTMVRLVES